MPFDEKMTDIFMGIRSGLARTVGGIVPPKEIEDIVQETYVRACQVRSDTDIKSPRSFMYKTARNIALNHVSRAESRLTMSTDQDDRFDSTELQDPHGDVLNSLCSAEKFAFLCDAVRSLPVQCRRAFVLKKVYGHSYREIAEIMNISEKTVEKHISKGITRCKAFIEQQYSNRSKQIWPAGQKGGRE